MKIVAKLILIQCLFVSSMVLMISPTNALFTDQEFSNFSFQAIDNFGNGEWDRSSLEEVTQYGDCTSLTFEIRNTSEESTFQSSVTYTVYHNPYSSPFTQGPNAASTVTYYSGSFSETIEPTEIGIISVSFPEGLMEGYYAFEVEKPPGHPAGGYFRSGEIYISGCGQLNSAIPPDEGLNEEPSEEPINEEPAEEPSEEPIDEEPTEEPIETPIEIPIETPIEIPVEEPEVKEPGESEAPIEPINPEYPELVPDPGIIIDDPPFENEEEDSIDDSEVNSDPNDEMNENQSNQNDEENHLNTTIIDFHGATARAYKTFISEVY